MSITIKAVAKQLPKYSRETKEILPFVEQWLSGKDNRFRRKVLKIFEGAGVDKRYSIMDAPEVFFYNSFEERNDIYIREIKTAKLARYFNENKNRAWERFLYRTFV